MVLLENVAYFGPGAIRVLFGKLSRTETVEISLRNVGTITLRPSDSDYAVFVQVFRQRQYDIFQNAQGRRLFKKYETLLAEGRTPVIIDAGANVGASAIWFARKFPMATVVAVEPDPTNAAFCKLNTAPYPRITTVVGGIAGKPGHASVGCRDNGQSWSVQTTRHEGGGDTELFTVDDLLGKAGPNAALFIAKIDIEGFEADLFSSNTEWLRSVDAVYVEPHDWLYPDQGTSRSLQKSAFGIGFELLISGENLVFVKEEEHATNTAEH